MNRSISRATLIGVVLLLVFAGPLVRTVCYIGQRAGSGGRAPVRPAGGGADRPGAVLQAALRAGSDRLPKTYQFWIGNENEILVDLPTADGKKIDVTPWAAWRITDPIRFLEVLRTVENAHRGCRLSCAARCATR